MRIFIRTIFIHRHHPLYKPSTLDSPDSKGKTTLIIPIAFNPIVRTKLENSIHLQHYEYFNHFLHPDLVTALIY
jgi:hypothetical protein